MYLETDFYLNCTHAVNSSKSQNQTCMTLRMDDRIDKYSAKSLRTDAQRMTANIPAGGVEKLLLSYIFHLRGLLVLSVGSSFILQQEGVHI